jgi:hypothetical protein
MRTLLTAALIVTSSILPVHAGEFESAESFIEWYGKGQDISPRLLIRGIGEGISAYNALQETRNAEPFYCPPNQLGIVDAQYVAIMRGFLVKYPKTKTQPVAAVLLYALQDAFPCKPKT